MQTIRPQRWCELRWLFAALAWVFVLPGASALAQPDELYQAAARMNARHVAELEQLAVWCDERGLAEQARQTRGVLGPRDPYKLYLPVLPQVAGRVKPSADASPDVVEWDGRLTRLRRDQSNALFELARNAVRRRRPSLAYDLVLAAVRVNPNHEAVRRLLGYQEYHGQWHTADEVRRLRIGQVWHEKFGWLPKSHVLRYEQGQRFNRGRWITAEQDAQLHHDIRAGWQVDTEHYSILTNHSLESGVALGVKLERLYRIWQQIFPRYYATEAQVLALFDGRARAHRAAMPKLNVVYFRDRDDYNRFLKPTTPNIEVSIGFYHDLSRRAYFFAGKEYHDRTLYHEATHQLFHQSRPVSPNVGRQANFWIVEGIAMFMESLHREGDYQVLGGFEDQRLYAARHRLLKDDFYVPLAELTTYGIEKLQSDQRIGMIYSQAAGLTHFLVFHDGGRYRDALVAYLSAVYNGNNDPGTLATLAGASYAQLDQQYRQFMQQSARREESGGQ